MSEKIKIDTYDEYKLYVIKSLSDYPAGAKKELMIETMLKCFVDGMNFAKGNLKVVIDG